MQILIRWWPCCGSNGPLIVDGYGGEEEEEKEEANNSNNSNNNDNDNTNNSNNNIINNRINGNISNYVYIKVDDSDERKISTSRDKKREDSMS